MNEFYCATYKRTYSAHELERVELKNQINKPKGKNAQ